MADRAINTDLNMLNTSRILNLPDAQLPQEPATLAQVQALVERNAFKDDVRAASTANINLAAPGATIDAIAMASGDRFLAKDQSTASQNGIYIWNGAAVAATRALDASTFDELEGAEVRVTEGTLNAGTKWVQTQVNGVIGTNNVVFASASSSAPPASETTAGIAEIVTQAEADAGTDDVRYLTALKGKNASWQVRKFSQTIGDGSATSFTVTHNLNNARAIVTVSLTGGTFDEVLTEVEYTSANSVTIKTNTAIAAAAYTVHVVG
jgi:hypothetical protein